MNPLIIAAAFLALKAKKTVSNVEKLQIEPIGIKFNKQTKKFILIIQVLNPTTQAFTIDSLFISVFNNGKKLGTVEKFEPFQIEKQGRSNIELPVKVSFIGVGQFIADTFIKKVEPKIEVKGEVRYKGLSIPISKQIDLNVSNEK